MTKVQYAQEYLGEFVDELMQFFSTELIKECMILTPNQESESLGERFLGVDIARMGEDETALTSVKRINHDSVEMIDLEVTTKTTLTETTLRIIEKDKKLKFKKIYLDDGGLGVGVLDNLLNNIQTKRKTIPINNSSRSLDKDDKQKKKLMKEDLYNNLLNLMEKKKVKLFDIPEIFLSLKSIQYEYTEKGDIRIYGSYSHITESLIRACWCVKDKTLNIYVK